MSETALVDSEEWVPAEIDVRQQILVLYLGGSALNSRVVAWSSYDPARNATGQIGEDDEPPYRTGFDALADGWRLLHMSQLLPPERGLEYSTDYHNFECVFERLLVRRAERKEQR